MVALGRRKYGYSEATRADRVRHVVPRRISFSWREPVGKYQWAVLTRLPGGRLQFRRVVDREPGCTFVRTAAAIPAVAKLLYKANIAPDAIKGAIAAYGTQ